MLNLITPIIATFNEASNIERVLAALTWAEEVLVIDSFSTDETLDICAQFNNVRVIQNEYIGPTEQSNFGLSQDIKTPWVLSMDADYIVTEDLQNEISGLSPSNAVRGFEIGFEYLINGLPLRGSLYPPRTALYRRKFAHYRRDGHTQRVEIDGLVLNLQCKIQHDDRKPYSRWLASQRKYAAQEAHKLSASNWKNLSWPDRLRYWGIAPFVIIPYTLLIKGVVLSGKPGLEYTRQRFIAEMHLQLARIKLKFRK
jgi:glycosyltransferase involved in cell wall biosynthesis